MNKPFGEDFVCWMCDHGLVLVAVLVVMIIALMKWRPEIPAMTIPLLITPAASFAFSPTGTGTPTATTTPLPVLTATSTPEPLPKATQMVRKNFVQGALKSKLQYNPAKTA